MYREARGPGGNRIEEDIEDRKVIYETETSEEAAYIVAKIKTQMRIHVNRMFTRNY